MHGLRRLCVLDGVGAPAPPKQTVQDMLRPRPPAPPGGGLATSGARPPNEGAARPVSYGRLRHSEDLASVPEAVGLAGGVICIVLCRFVVDRGEQGEVINDRCSSEGRRRRESSMRAAVWSWIVR